MPEESDHLFSSENEASLPGMYQTYFLDYASYVILERAVPAIEDGLKPVQRRILHSMYELEDGRYNKVANVIGNTMKYHPHGDASINDAMVQMGQKDLLIDCQGNWGNILTGDSAAASRYIEARLTKFALEVVFNDKTTNWSVSYDGRNKEPVTHPAKFPILLAQGVEGIAVGLACKIMPHNFIELIDASIDILRNRKTQILPDFPTGGMADFSKYNSGLRGGKIRVRAKLSIVDHKTIMITEIPFGTTTGQLIDSIVSAGDKGKIKIKKVEDNTAENVEILIHLTPGISPDVTVDALYAFTDCEMSISPNSCVIVQNKPIFMPVDEILRVSTFNTLELLKRELEINLSELQEKWHYTSLEKIFFEEKIYKELEKKYGTWDKVLEGIAKAFIPFTKKLKREITREDIIKLTEKPVRRIYKLDIDDLNEQIKGLENNIKDVKDKLKNLVPFAIEYFKDLKKKYGKGRERKTEIRSFEQIEVKQIVIRSEKLYVDYENGFAGTGLKGATFIDDCADVDDLIVFREDGTMTVSKVSDKAYIGKGILHVAIWHKDDERTIYHMVYRDGLNGAIMMKRFNVTGIIRDKEYDLTKGTKNSKVLYFSVNPQGESEILTIYLKPRPKLKKQVFDIDLTELGVKGRNSQGNVLSKFPIRKIVSKSKGESTLELLKYWYDPAVKRINTEDRGISLGGFKEEEKIININPNGVYRVIKPGTILQFDDDPMIIMKYNPARVITAVYYDGFKKEYWVKRFQPEVMDKNVHFITEHEKSKILLLSFDTFPILRVTYGIFKGNMTQDIDVNEFSPSKSEKAKGTKLNFKDIKQLDWMPSKPEPKETRSGTNKEIDLEKDDDQKKLF
jgi:topoisomerase IV subunit A